MTLTATMIPCLRQDEAPELVRDSSEHEVEFVADASDRTVEIEFHSSMGEKKNEH